MHHIHIYKYVHGHTPLAKPSFCSGGRISCKPNNGALLTTSINHNDDSKSPNYCALLGTSINSNSDSNSSNVTSSNAIHSTVNKKVTMIATMVPVIRK